MRARWPGLSDLDCAVERGPGLEEGLHLLLVQPELCQEDGVDDGLGAGEGRVSSRHLYLSGKTVKQHPSRVSD